MRSWVLVVAVASSAYGAYACGSEDAGDSTFTGGSAGAGGSAAGGSGGAGGLNPDGSAGSAGSGGTKPDLCGGQPCANHTGENSFNDPSAPANAGDLFNAGTPNPNGTNPGNEPAMVYPSHETMFPINVSRIHHEWSPGGTNSLFHLQFTGPKTTVHVYTANPNWQPSEAEWDWIAESNRGDSVELVVFGLDQTSPSSVWQSKPITLYFSDAEVEGAIYYWSTASAGVMKALVSDPVPVKFYTDPQATDADTCVACHTLSRDGKRLAVGYGGEKLREVDVPGRTTLVPTATSGERASAWTTFSPDGKLLLVAASGVLTLIDSDTGATVGANDGIVPLPAGKIGTHPDWNALGDTVVFTLGTKGGNKDVEGGEIALLPYNGGAWGTPQVIVPSAGGVDNNFFPSWSPDSKWIMFANAQGKSKDAVTATLKLVGSTGGTPKTLARLNQRVNASDGVTDIGNSMPTWAPSTKPGIFWIAFSSLRAYATLRPQDDKEDQIWIAAVDPTLPEPGYAAFWAPFQSIPEGNHRAFWTHTDTDKQCLCVDICGDGLDNDCDGTADESQCTPQCAPAEICGNGVDDDCDCLVDDCAVEPPA
jgi:hypothetical protein